MPGSNINTYTHKPGTLCELSAHWGLISQGLKREATAFELLICIQTLLETFTCVRPKTAFDFKIISTSSSFLHIINKLKTTKSIHNRQIPERIKFPHTLHGILCTYSAANRDYFLCILESKAHHAHPCCWLSSAAQNVMHPWPHSLRPARLRWLHLRHFCPWKHLRTLLK